MFRFTHITVRDGLSSNQINTIYKDSQGFMWFGTHSGANRYDGHSFRVFRYVEMDTTSLIDEFVTKIFEDYLGNIWMLSRGGVSIYCPATDSFTHSTAGALGPIGIADETIQYIFQDSRGFYWYVGAENLYKFCPASRSTIRLDYLEGAIRAKGSNLITSISETSHGDLWVSTESGVLVKIDALNNRVLETNTFLAERFQWRSYEYSITVDSDDDLWVAITSDAHGVFYMDSKKGSFEHFHRESTRLRLNNDIVSGILQDNQGLIWIGTDHGGVNVINKSNLSVTYLVNDPYHERSISQNSITAIYKDETGVIWLGTYKKGVNYYHEDIIKFRTIRSVPSDSRSLGFNDVNCFAQDSKGNIWVGTNGGGLKYFNRKDQTFRHFLHDEANPNTISSNVVVSLHVDSHDKLWVGTFHGGLNYYDGERFHHYKADGSSANGGLSSNHVWNIIEDSRGNLWIATLGGGLNMFDRRRGTFVVYRADELNSISSDYLIALAFDRNENLWIATGDGLDMLDRQSGRFINYVSQRGAKGTLSNLNVNSLKADSRGRVWVGTRDGLNLFCPRTKEFIVFRTDDGLPSNTINSICEDQEHNLWIGTLGGLSNMRLTFQGDSMIDFHFKNYDELDGLQGKEFNLGAALATSDGEMLFGGANGFNLFMPNQLKLNTRVPKVLITDFQIFNRPIGVKEEVNGRVLLSKSINQTDKIVLKHKENMFSIGFAALSYFHPEKNKYLYMLDGFNNEWLEADPATLKATYTNMDPGEYVFRVMASNNDGIWNHEGASIAIKVLPPFWKSRLAFIIYLVIVATLLLTLRLLIIKRTHYKIAIEQEQKDAQRRHEFDMLKIKLFTNISHEFKTPLTLIINPLEKILKENSTLEYRSQLQLVHRNARRLLNLVSQLLDFRRMEVQEVKLNPVLGDIVKYSEDICHSFSDLSEKRSINLSFSANVAESMVYFDHEKYERILFNLLSNAFKFTSESGSIEVSLEIPDTELQGESNSEQGQIKLSVRDNGIGVPKEKQEMIFERFFQNFTPGKSLNPGSGIGLSMVTEYVKLHKGSMQLDSEPGKGSCFTIYLPYLTKQPLDEDLPCGSTNEAELTDEPATTEDKRSAKKPHLLIVEDNEDFRFYLKDNLKVTYSISEACNGSEGLKAAINSIPDLIVTDVMMPEMDGVEMSKRIRNDSRTSHIPIILLTARASEDHKVLGFEVGVDDYLPKPFSFEILESRIRNLIVQRELLRAAFQKHFEVSPSEVSVTSLDEKLIRKAIDIVEKNISNSEFSVEELSREVGMSRVHLYKKLLSLTGKTPIEFIRILRLKRAAQLLRESQLSVSEIAYEVGFNNPKYFTKYFKAEFSILPSQYAAQANLNQKDNKNFDVGI